MNKQIKLQQLMDEMKKTSGEMAKAQSNLLTDQKQIAIVIKCKHKLKKLQREYRKLYFQK